MATAAVNRADAKEELDRIGWLPKPTTRFRNRSTAEQGVPQTLYVPGVGCPIYTENPDAQRFAHGASDWSQQRLTLREAQMLRAMNEFTDLPDWSLPPAVDAWRENAMNMHLINDQTWDWCRRELQDLAEKYQQRKFVTIFDSSSRLCKSDVLISSQLLTTLRSAAAKLQNIGTHDSTTSDLLDPSLFPFVHGRTRVLLDGTQVPLRDSTEFIGHGQLTEPPKVMRPGRAGSAGFHETHLREMAGQLADDDSKARFYRWSDQFQWLPCDVQFTPDDQSGVKISSYINNLHPEHNQLLYQAIEEAISLSIEPWNEVLAYPDKPRTPLRIRTYGVEWGPERPSWADEDLLRRLDKMADEEKETSPEYQRVLGLIDEYDKVLNHEGSSAVSFHDEDHRKSLYIRTVVKHNTLYHWKQPEPGHSFTYDEWKKGQTGRPIVGGRDLSSVTWVSGKLCEAPPRFDYADHEFYSISLRDKFRDSGLQVIIRMASIDVSQQAPNYQGTDWRVNGFLNEHIVATSLVFFDVKDITQSSMSFRVEADLESGDYQFKGFNFQEIAAMYGLEYDDLEGGDALEELGEVRISQGRTIVYPNTLQHKWNSFELAPGASNGYLRYLEIHLVDPHYRLVSTANVPPQQHDWWYEAGPGRINWATYNLPREIIQLTLNEVGQWPMGIDEARDIKVEMEEERKVAMEAVMGGVVWYQFYI